MNDVIISDAAVAGAALGTVLLALVVQLRAPFVALCGWLQVIISFPLAYFVYFQVLDVRFMGALHFMSLFAVFGIGADDVFVLCALWNAAGARHKDLSARMEEALPHAAGAMLATSSTTAAAFFANGISSLRRCASSDLCGHHDPDAVPVGDRVAALGVGAARAAQWLLLPPPPLRRRVALAAGRR